MNRDQLIALVLGRCGRQEGNSYLSAQAVLELQAIQDRLEGDPLMPWFLLSPESSLFSTANTKATALPADFLREYEDFPLYYYDATAADPYTRLTKDEYDVLESQYGETTPTIPKAYALQGSEIDWFATPDAVYEFRWKYFQKGAVLSASDSTNVWTINAADLLIGELGFVIAGQYKRDTARAQIFASQIVQARQRLKSFHIAREQQNRDARMGDTE